MINERELIRDLGAKLPTKVIDGAEVLDFKDSEIIPFLLGIIVWQDEVLLTKRSEEVNLFAGLWHIVAGHYDQDVEPQDKLLEEFNEELGYCTADFLEITKRDNILMERPGKQDWLLIPFVCRLKSKKDVVLNWENTASKWVKLSDLSQQEELVPGVASLVQRLVSR